MLYRVLTVSVCLMVLVGCVGPDPGEDVGVLRGRVQSGMAAIGGETTGVVLQRPAKPAVELVLAGADRFNGQSVEVRGHWSMRRGPERGDRWVFVVEEIRAVDRH